MDAIEPDRRRELALSCLRKGEAARQANAPQSGATRAELTGLGQAKIAFVDHLMGLCSRFSVRAFASIVDKDAPRPTGEFLRKDYSYSFLSVISTSWTHHVSHPLVSWSLTSWSDRNATYWLIRWPDTSRIQLRAEADQPVSCLSHSSSTQT